MVERKKRTWRERQQNGRWGSSTFPSTMMGRLETETHSKSSRHGRRAKSQTTCTGTSLERGTDRVKRTKKKEKKKKNTTHLDCLLVGVTSSPPSSRIHHSSSISRSPRVKSDTCRSCLLYCRYHSPSPPPCIVFSRFVVYIAAPLSSKEEE